MARLSFTTSRALGKSALRRANERLLLDSIRRRPGISRAAIAALTGFSRTSVTFVVNRLIRQGLVEENKAAAKARGKAASRTGRPPSELRLVGSALMAVGVEISRPQCRVILVDLTGTRLYEGTAPWTADSDALFVQIQAIIRAIAGGRRSRRVIGVGVSLPGTIDKATGRIVAAESLGWFGVEAGRRLSAGLPWQFWFENDSNLSALAEQWFGDPQARALRHFVSVRPQGGLGTGVIVDGRPLHGVSAAAAEFGHVMLYPEGRPCNCGNRGCWEQYVSDAALVRAWRERSGGQAGADSAPLEEAFRIVDLALGGDTAALEALHETARYLALGCVNLMAALNPEAIILGEPYSRAWPLIEDIVRLELRNRVPPYQLTGLRLLPSRLGSDAALLGAAALVLTSYFTRFEHDDATESSSVLMEAVL